MIIIQIEHIRAFEELDAILAIEGIDSICVGPCDLSASMGKLDAGEDDPEVREVIDEICSRAGRAGVMIGSFSSPSPEKIQKWLKRKANWLGVCSDWGCISSSSSKMLNEIRECTHNV